MASRWIRPEVYPLFATTGVAVGICAMQLVRNITTNPEVRSGASAHGRSGCAKRAGGGASSSSLPVSTLSLLELLPFFVGSFGWVEMTAGQQEKLKRPKRRCLVPGSPLAEHGKEAGGWRDGGGLGQLSGEERWDAASWQQGSAASSEVGQRRGTGAVLVEATRCQCLCGGSLS
ncbi:hypothetical protein OsI_25618 [Oryza sativa Indica Group]|uniref:Uncharacterized protein n=1 Tax=Oryza sativa subsp. indica TaxID=39946 RepID=B8B510_ORYSI|nr:hypothetical protein OsI_25618 [Oryza sativa Indica Group]